jgi:hemoglobin-like flavoprotein
MNNGIIYQYAGDEIIAVFGAGGGDSAKVCLDAVRAALGMLYAIDRLNRWELKNFSVNMGIGIGIHFGRAFIGNIGHYRHKQFAIIGDPMNVTSRIQTKNKDLGTELLISEDAFRQVPEGTFKVGLESEVELKGKEGSFKVFEISGFVAGEGQLLLQSSIHQILKNEEAFASRFYDKVFSLSPEARSLFSDSLVAQGSMLTHMLRGIIYMLSRPEYLQMGLKALGAQHEEYGVKPEHYPVVKQALLETIVEELGDEYTPATGAAWNDALNMITSTMTA